MLTKGDDYPLHQTPEPVAYAGGDRNFYDRYFFNGYSEDGSLFFALALGIYPQLDIIDASFCLLAGGVQHNVRSSRRLGSERLDLEVGPIRVEIVEPLKRLRIIVGGKDSPVRADLVFTGRHAPIEEPRFTRRNGPRLFMDYTRMTQSGDWEGTASCDGKSWKVAPGTHLGTRDRSWGIRPVGAPDSQPPPMGSLPQFFWLWAPLNFPGHATFFHTNDDAAGEPWNRRAVIDAIGEGVDEYAHPAFGIGYAPGTRRIETLTVDLAADTRLLVEPTGVDFHMSGLGYTHPEWGHGMDHGVSGGEAATAYDRIEPGEGGPHDQLDIHIQAFSRAVLTVGGEEHRGHGVLEQFLIGPHAPSGFAGLLDPAP